MAGVFRKKAIDRLSTPEQLDKMIPIVRPSTWLVVAGFAIICISVIIWAFTAIITETYSCRGIVIDNSNQNDNSPNEIICFIPITETRGISTGMDVSISLPGGERIAGEVYQENYNIESDASISMYYNDPTIATYLTDGSPAYSIICRPIKETKDVLVVGLIVDVDIVISSQRPIQYVFPTGIE